MVERIGEKFGVLLTSEQMTELELVEGTRVNLSKTADPAFPTREVRYASTEEVMRAFRETQAQYDEVYRELAQ